MFEFVRTISIPGFQLQEVGRILLCFQIVLSIQTEILGLLI